MAAGPLSTVRVHVPVVAPSSATTVSAPVIASVIAPPAPPSATGDPAADREAGGASRSEPTGAATTAAPPAPDTAAVDYEAGLLAGVNAERRAAGLAPLSASSCADGYAESWADRLASTGAFSHQDLGPVMSGCDAGAAAENIARTGGSASSMVGMWMSSPGHRANILDPDLTHVGTAGVLVDGTWTGVQLFLTR